jgi:hypothetical protein
MTTMMTAHGYPSMHESMPAPSHEEIAARAFALFEKRGASDGRDLDDWLEAERELLHERSRTVTEAFPPLV